MKKITVVLGLLAILFIFYTDVDVSANNANLQLRPVSVASINKKTINTCGCFLDEFLTNEQSDELTDIVDMIESGSTLSDVESAWKAFVEKAVEVPDMDFDKIIEWMLIQLEDRYSDNLNSMDNMQIQAQALQQLSNVSKIMHDTVMAVMRKMD